MELKLPKTLIDDISENELKLYLAIMLYKERKISISQAAKLAGLTLSDFIFELGKHKAAFTNITTEELEEQLRIAVKSAISSKEIKQTRITLKGPPSEEIMKEMRRRRVAETLP